MRRTTRLPTLTCFSRRPNLRLGHTVATKVSLAAFRMLQLVHADSSGAYGAVIWDELKHMTDIDSQQRSESTDRLKLLCYCVGCLLDVYELKTREILQMYMTIKNAPSYPESKHPGCSPRMFPSAPEPQLIGQQISWVQRIGPLIRLLIGKGTMRYLYARKTRLTQSAAPELDGSLLIQVFLLLWHDPDSSVLEHSRKLCYDVPFSTYLSLSLPSSEYARDIISHLQEVSVIP